MVALYLGYGGLLTKAVDDSLQLEEPERSKRSSSAGLPLIVALDFLSDAFYDLGVGKDIQIL